MTYTATSDIQANAVDWVLFNTSQVIYMTPSAANPSAGTDVK